MAPSRGAADEELDDEVVFGGAEGKVGSGGEVFGVAEDAVAELASSGVRMTPPGGTFSLLYLHPAPRYVSMRRCVCFIGKLLAMFATSAGPVN